MDDEGYKRVGVSASKEDVRAAIRGQNKGLYPGAFCKIVDDIVGDDTYCAIVHADGAALLRGRSQS